MKNFKFHRYIILLLFACCYSISLYSQHSPYTITLLTISPGEEIYSTFGHSALRVINHQTGQDYVYNYGTFDFDEPMFYWKFIKGKLPYSLSRIPTQYAFRNLVKEHRTAIENKLNLSETEELNLVRNLEINYLPKNRNYYYDFFYDNCATRILAITDSSIFQRHIVHNTAYIPQSFKKLVNPYLRHLPWAKLGIWILMGKEGNRKANYQQSAFLPDYLKSYLKNNYSEKDECLLGRDTTIVKSEAQTYSIHFFSPLSITILLALAILGLTIFQKKTSNALFVIDKLLFWITALLSLLIISLWVISNHSIYAWNANLLWLIPYPFLGILIRLKANNKITSIIVLLLFGTGIIYVLTQITTCPAIVLICFSIAIRFYQKIKFSGLFPNIL